MYIVEVYDYTDEEEIDPLEKAKAGPRQAVVIPLKIYDWCRTCSACHMPGECPRQQHVFI